MEKPVGFWLETVGFSWNVTEAVGNTMVAAEIKISLDAQMESVLYTSGKCADINPLCYEPQLDWEEATRYFWAVTVWDETGDTATSEVTYFETPKSKLDGIFMKAPFDESPIFSKELELTKEVKSARLYITGLGVYEASLNGKLVSDEYLAPFYNSYDHWIQYQTYDVTSQLQVGMNEIQVMLGDGWYKGRMGFDQGGGSCLYGDSTQMICDLVIEYVDDQKVCISSDTSWNCKPSAVVFSDIYDGEIFDQRLVGVGTWVPAIEADMDKNLKPRLSIPVKVQEIIKPIEIIHTNAGETVLDFGQVMTGYVEFSCDEVADTEVFFQFGEILQEGNFYNDNLRTAKQEYRYISDGTKQLVRPHFTFYGFRYMKITGMTHVSLENFAGHVVYSQMDRTGYIETSNAKINQLFSNALWGQKGNFLDTPTDCPQRDERLGWTGDAQMFCATASFNMYTPAFFHKYLYDMKMEQQTLDGAVPFVVPDILKKRNLASEKENTSLASCAWGDAATIIPWQMYQFFGDKTLLKAHYDNMKMWTDYIKRVDDTQCGGSRLWNVGFHFADWLALDNYDKDSSFGGTDCYFIASAYYLYSAELTAKVAGVLGYKEDEAYYSGLAQAVRAAMQHEYVSPSGRLGIQTQTAYVLALHFHIIQEEYREKTIVSLKTQIEKDKMHLTTGFVGTPYLCPTLCECGLEEYAYRLLLNESYPSWLYEVNMGATTIWERWNSVMPDGSMNPKGMNSLNHYAYGSIVEWMYRYMAGINIEESHPGFKEFIIKPYVDDSFTWVKASYQSPYGLIRSEWEIVGDEVHYDIEVPFDTTATLILGEEKTVLTKGTYHIVKGR